MATQIKNVVRFQNVQAGGTVSLPHGLLISPPGGGEIPQAPDLVIPSGPGFLVSADDTEVTVTNQTATARSVDVYVETWHSLERAFGDVANLELAPRPFVVDLGAGIMNASAAVLGFGAGEIGTGIGSDWLWPWFDEDAQNNGGELGFLVEIVAPRAGTLRNLYVRHNAALGNGQPVVYTVLKNGVATALSASLATGALGQASNLVAAVPVAQGDRLTMTAVRAASIAVGVETTLKLQIAASMQFGV